jgi:serine/threonine protein kinase
MNARLIGGRYELLDRLGAGGMGEVCRSRDRLTEEIVALKRALRMPSAAANTELATCDLSETKTRNPAAIMEVSVPPMCTSEQSHMGRLALASEFRVLSSLRHPNIVSVLDYGFQSDGLPFFTMELLPDPVDIVCAARGQPLDFQLDLLFQLLRALSYLHRHGIVHRDLKPPNVLVTGHHVTVLDFGVAGLPECAVAGTAGYIAPEVIAGGRPTPASDFYAVGAIAYEVLTAGSSQHSLPLVGQNRDAALEGLGMIGQLIKTLLSPDPIQRRYTDANILMADFARVAGREVPAETSAHRDSCLKAAPLTGRKAELELLSSALESAMAGKGSVWLVGGESGVGKSRLLGEVRARALVQGFLALTGRAEENQAPYSLSRDSVLRLALVVEVSDEEAGILKIVFPEIERVLGRPVPDVAVDPQVFQERIIDVIASLFQRYKGPILLELEDCHMVGSSLKVIQRLTQMAGELPLLLIASYRDDERPYLPSECPAMRLMRMTRFDHSEICEITASMLGKELGSNPAVVTFLERETEGNAFFLVEAVRELADAAGRLDRVLPEMLPEHVLSGGMKDYARRRLDRVPAWAQTPIQIAALIGRDIDLDVLRAAVPDADLDEVLVFCGDAAILEGYGYHRRFTHDKIREAVLGEIGEDLHCELSRRAANAIESVHGVAQDWIQTQAVLWKEAGIPDKAAHYLLLAAMQRLSIGAPEKAVQFGVAAAGQLGVDLPDSRDLQGAAFGLEMQKIGELMAGRGPAQLAEFPPLTDQRVARVISILMLIGPAAHISRKVELFALSTLKSFTLTLEHGIGSDGPQVIAMYAAVVRELTQNSLMAHEFSTLAIELDQRLYGRASSPVAFLHAWFVNHWINPLKTNLAFAWDGARIGLNENELLYGCFNAAAYVMYLNFSGAPLQQVVKEADRQMARIAERVRVATFHCLLERQVALALQGRTLHRLSLSDDNYEEERDIASISGTSNYNQILYYCIAKMRLHYYYDEYESASRYAEQALPIFPAFQGQIGEWEFVFYRALVSAALAQELSGPERESRLSTAQELLAKFEVWARVGEANFAHKRDLIRAEILRARNERDSAADAFETAVISAAASGFVHDLALAHERASLFYHWSDDVEKCRTHAQDATTYYDTWEAWAKSRMIRDTLLSSKLPGISPKAARTGSKRQAESQAAALMTPERWERTKKLFEAAQDLEASDLDSFFNRACPEDVALRFEVESLLASFRRACVSQDWILAGGEGRTGS